MKTFGSAEKRKFRAAVKAVERKTFKALLSAPSKIPYTDDVPEFIKKSASDFLNKKFPRGKRIRSLKDLVTAAMNKKAVIVPGSRTWPHRRPAAFVVNLPGSILQRLLDEGMFEYRSLKERK